MDYFCKKCSLEFTEAEITAEDENGNDLCPACSSTLISEDNRSYAERCEDEIKKNKTKVCANCGKEIEGNYLKIGDTVYQVELKSDGSGLGVFEREVAKIEITADGIALYYKDWKTFEKINVYYLTRSEDEEAIKAEPQNPEIKVGGIYRYGNFENQEKNNSAIVQVVAITESREIAVIRFLKVENDDTGNGMFTYLYRTEGTMNASIKYLTPCEYEEPKNQPYVVGLYGNGMIWRVFKVEPDWEYNEEDFKQWCYKALSKTPSGVNFVYFPTEKGEMEFLKRKGLYTPVPLA